jgi:hypothetical protein
MRVFIVILLVAVLIIVVKKYTSLKNGESVLLVANNTPSPSIGRPTAGRADKKTVKGSGSVPDIFKTRIFVSIRSLDAHQGALQISQILKSAANPALVTVGISHVVGDHNDGGGITAALVKIGQGRWSSNIRVTLVKDPNTYECHVESLSRLLSDETLIVVVSDRVSLPFEWDVRVISVHREVRKNKDNPVDVIFTSSAKGHFAVCAGDVHGIPYFEPRSLAIEHDDFLVPTTSLFMDFLCVTRRVCSALFYRPPSGVAVKGQDTTPEWALEAVLSSRAHGVMAPIIGSSSFKLGVTGVVHPPDREKYSPSRVAAKVSATFLEFLGWDFERRAPTGRARMGISRAATPLEKRLKWGDESQQDFATIVATGEFV